ncbi:hypothetical protein I7I50_00253 [Histoplasma capsulatum G186AR]|uniref:Uncharacterized protein n=1 Tax=Ajellomyces capsulatus TaxID=5037 RepID=A0A8H7YIB8_AJECA|nr:hypothetical protein I7I52_07521 [Histoplasma capsulatum]QSS72411.1 hypothetical protein I7I50_00253 [Histoplasma capsulatum G186AR]
MDTKPPTIKAEGLWPFGLIHKSNFYKLRVKREGKAPKGSPSNGGSSEGISERKRNSKESKKKKPRNPRTASWHCFLSFFSVLPCFSRKNLEKW